MNLSLFNFCKALAVLCIAGLLFSCSSDEAENDTVSDVKTLSFSFMTRATSGTATTELFPSTVTLFGARASSLFVRTNLTTSSGRASSYAKDGDVLYFVSGLSDGAISTVDSTVSTLLNATLTSSASSPAQDFLVGHASIGANVKSGESVDVELEHSTARIDLKLDGDASNIVISKLTLEGVSSSTYIFPSDYVAGQSRPDLTGTTTYTVDFGADGFTTGIKESASYVYETAAGVRAVLDGTQDGTPVKYAVVLPKLDRGSVYVITITNDKANVSVGFTVRDWADGGSYNATLTD